MPKQKGRTRHQSTNNLIHRKLEIVTVCLCTSLKDKISSRVFKLIKIDVIILRAAGCFMPKVYQVPDLALSATKP